MYVSRRFLWKSTKKKYEKMYLCMLCISAYTIYGRFDMTLNKA